MLEAQSASTVTSFSPSFSHPGPSPASRVKTEADPFAPLDTFSRRHIGPQPDEIDEMLRTLKYASLDELVDDVIPPAIRLRRPLDLPPAKGEREALEALREIMSHNKVFRSFI